MAVLKAILLSSALLACVYAQGEPVHVELAVSVTVGGGGRGRSTGRGRRFCSAATAAALKDRLGIVYSRRVSLPRTMHWLSFMPSLRFELHKLSLHKYIYIYIAFLGFLSDCVG